MISGPLTSLAFSPWMAIRPVNRASMMPSNTSLPSVSTMASFVIK
ncbi:Uncharacterised protein [Mycobacterium tuberculosis]|nr:Uncharacterised protein [Mycobacterium tuberculosis]